MNQKKSVRLISNLTLGAFNGLLVGLLLEKARIAYLNYQMSIAAREYAKSDWAVDFVEAHWEPLVPLVCIAVFAMAAYLHQYFRTRPEQLLILWYGLGAVAIGTGYFMSTSKPDVFSFLCLVALVGISYSAYKLSKKRPEMLSLRWVINGISALVMLAFGVQLVGLFFYWKELRRPLLWLICLIVVVATNAIYGTLIQLIADRFSRSKVTHVNSY